MRRKSIAFFIIIIAIGILLLMNSYDLKGESSLMTYYLENHLVDTGAENSVTAIYLDYRMFDTIFEALLLIISITGVIHFLVPWEKKTQETLIPENVNIAKSFEKNRVEIDSINDEESSEILDFIIKILYPITIIFALYISINGYKTPGGGFQSGVIAAAVFMSRYLVKPDEIDKTAILKTVEKIVYILILSLGTTVILTSIKDLMFTVKEIYLIIMNLFIAIKVFCGISIIFFNFTYKRGEDVWI